MALTSTLKATTLFNLNMSTLPSTQSSNSSSNSNSSSPNPSIVFLAQVSSDYPQFNFRPSTRFRFRPPATIYYDSSVASHFNLLLLHELSHALLGHFSFASLAERLQCERDAWQKTAQLCQEYRLPYDSAYAEANLDTYRDWLHQKTRCKTCGSTCLELDQHQLFCPFCQKTIKISR